MSAHVAPMAAAPATVGDPHAGLHESARLVQLERVQGRALEQGDRQGAVPALPL